MTRAFSVLSWSAVALSLVAASCSRMPRTCAAAFRIAVPESCIEWLPAV